MRPSKRTWCFDDGDLKVICLLRFVKVRCYKGSPTMVLQSLSRKANQNEVLVWLKKRIIQLREIKEKDHLQDLPEAHPYSGCVGISFVSTLLSTKQNLQRESMAT